MSRKLLVAFLLISFMLLATGCNYDQPIDPANGIWDKYFVFPLSWAIDYFAVLLNPTDNPEYDKYGWSIIIVTILIRLLTLPLMMKQLKSSKMMQALQPEMTKIREKYKTDQQKLQQETMKLFQKHNVNPLAGCLPILVQMPILIGIFHAIMRNPDIKTHYFLGFSLGEPLWILAILAGVTTYLQQKVMGGVDNPQMKIIMTVMPVMVVIFAWGFASALSLYWVIGNIFTIVQSYAMKDMYKLNQEGAAK